ncbi:MAG: hypothetical protein U0992_22745 [Planctomycetaceae bacterium]
MPTAIDIVMMNDAQRLSSDDRFEHRLEVVADPIEEHVLQVSAPR